jgi:anti-sigma regulatory factor (Ser/Thr protein kinase)
VTSGRWRGPGWRLFDADPACVKTVRDWIARIISAHACPVDPNDAALVVSELFGNAVVHGPDKGQVLVGYVLWPDGARIVVCDGGGPTLPQLQDSNDLAEGGRGLHVVDALAARWGSFRAVQAQVVWCDLGQPMHAAAGEAWAWLSAVLAEFSLVHGADEDRIAASGAAMRSAPPTCGAVFAGANELVSGGFVMSSPRLSVADVRPEERTTRLEALAAELIGRGWIAHVRQPPIGTERLFVQHRSRKERRGHVPDDRTGHWCYWFAVTGECIVPADEAVVAAGAIIRRLRAEERR